MKVMITYMSMSGNTKKVAEAIYGEIKEEKAIVGWEQIDHLEGYDLVFIGFPIMGFGPPEEIQEFIKTHCQGKKIALFITHGAPEHSNDLPSWLEKCQKTAAGANLIGMFNCQGELAQFVVDELLKSDNPKYQAWGKAAPSTKGQPDESRLKKAQTFATGMIEKLKTG